MTMIATVLSSVVETDSVQSSVLDLSNQSAEVTATVVSENSAARTNALHNHNFALLSPVATLALQTETALAVSSVAERESAKNLALDLSNQSAEVTVTVVSENSAVRINASQNHNFALV